MATLNNDHDGEYVNEAEEKVIKHLLSALPDNHLIIPNITITHPDTNHVDEIDALVVGPRWVTVVETKGYVGRVSFGDFEHLVDGQKRTDPITLTQSKAKRLAGLFSKKLPNLLPQEIPWFTSQVILANDPQFLDIKSSKVNQVVRLSHAAGRLQAQDQMIPTHIQPSQISKDTFLRTLGMPNPRKKGSRQFNQWRVLNILEDEELHTLYSVQHNLSGVEQYLRLHKRDPELSSREQEKQKDKVLRDFLAVAKVDQNAGWIPEIVGPLDADATDAGEVFILLPIPHGPSLDEFLGGLEDQDVLLNEIDALRIVRDIAKALKATHSVNISHRALSLATIFVNPNGEHSNQPLAKLGSWDKAFLSDQMSTGTTRLLNENTKDFHAPETLGQVEEWELVDLFAFGVCIEKIWSRGVKKTLPPTLEKLKSVLSQNNPDDRQVTAAEVVEKVEALISAKMLPEEKSIVATPQDSNAELLGGRYQILEQLGKGASSEVFSAQDVLTGKTIALKKFHQSLSIDDARREFGVLMNVVHQNIVRVFDIEEIENRIYLKMELLHGGTVAERITQDGLIDVGLATEWFFGLLEALHKFHSSTSHDGHCHVHRDVKPENLICEGERGLVLVDFGIAASSSGEVSGGTGRYRSVDYGVAEAAPAMDLFSLALVFHEVVTGVHPFGNEPICQGEPEISEELPISLQDWFRKALSSEVNKRFTSAEQMHLALREVSKRTDIPVISPIPEPVQEYKPPIKVNHDLDVGPKMRLISSNFVDEREIPAPGDPEIVLPKHIFKGAITTSSGIQLDLEMYFDSVIMQGLPEDLPNEVRRDLENRNTSWVQAVNAYDSPKFIQSFVHGFRLGIHPVPNEEGLFFVELRRTVIEDEPDWPRLRKATLEDLSLSAGKDVTSLLLDLGAEKVCTREEAYGETNNRKNQLCVVFPLDAYDVPLKAYALSRVAPLIPDDVSEPKLLDHSPLSLPDLDTPMSQRNGGRGDSYREGYEYYACHERNPWRAPAYPFKSIRTALFGSSGAKNLFAVNGQWLTRMVGQYGSALLVVVRLEEKAILTDGRDMACVPWNSIHPGQPDQIKQVFLSVERVPFNEDSFNK